MADWFSPQEESKRGRRSLLYGIVIGALVVAAIWAVAPGLVGSGSSDHTAQGSLTAEGGPTSASQGPADAAPQDRRLARCRRIYTRQQEPLDVAGAAMSQWEIHIAAMNKLVLGVISLDQAMQFWSRTRVGAKARLQTFDKAVHRLGRLTIACPAPGADPSAGPRLVRCERAVAANTKELDLAETALATWAMHVQHMEMLRDGEMTPEQASQLWLQSWHQGQDEVTQYRDAAKTARSLHCSMPSSS